MKLTKDRVAAYVDGGGEACPFCGALNLSGDGIDIEYGQAFQEITCPECGEVWTDVYFLDHIFQMED